MTPDDARALILRILGQIAPEADLSGLDPATELREQLDIDSMDFLNAMVALDEETGIDVPEEDYPRLETLQGAVDYLVTRSA
jgi:acyl carrier protein